MEKFWILVFVIFRFDGTIAAVCSASDRATDLTECLDQLKVKLVNTSYFWFGADYKTLCPNGPADGILCINSYPNKEDSLISRIFPTGIVFSMIDKYLDVKYTSVPGTYSGCGNTVVTNTTWTKEIDPTSDDTVYPWHVRHTPEMTWESDPNTLYTLLIYDVGYFFVHGLYININGSGVANAEVVKSYTGPLSTTNFANPFAFLLFKQNGAVTVPQDWVDKINGPSFVVKDFVADMNLNGPVAVNWIATKGDIYAAGTLLSQGLQNMCPVFIGNALDQKPRPFLPSSLQLSVSVDLNFTTEKFVFVTCCKTTTVPANTFKTDPIGNPLYTTAETRSETPPAVSLLKMGLFADAVNFTGDMYTLVCLDPDVPSASAGTEEKPILHMMVVNIVDGTVSTGDAVQPYSGPTPPDNNPHWYTFLLYKQEDTLNGTAMLGYAERPTRFLFDINKMVSENNLTLVGANWFTAARDDYVTYRYIQRTDNQTEIDDLCKGYSEYSIPCGTSGSSVLSYSSIFFAIIVFSAMIFNN